MTSPLTPARPAQACACQYDPRMPTDCTNATFPSRKPDGYKAQCNWACRCPLSCAGRELERGTSPRLQVFKHPHKGWCLRTLSPIEKDAFIMEYVAERIDSDAVRSRKASFPTMDNYLMQVAKGAGVQLDAYYVRNIAAFAAFACQTKFANMTKTTWLGHHWDKMTCHAVFVAKRNIDPGEELTYLRSDASPVAASPFNCQCGDPECSGRV